MEQMLRFGIGFIFAVFAVIGVMASFVLAFSVTLPRRDPWILLPYGAMLLGTAAVLLLRTYTEKN